MLRGARVRAHSAAHGSAGGERDAGEGGGGQTSGRGRGGRWRGRGAAKDHDIARRGFASQGGGWKRRSGGGQLHRWQVAVHPSCHQHGAAWADGSRSNRVEPHAFFRCVDRFFRRAVAGTSTCRGSYGVFRLRLRWLQDGCGVPSGAPVTGQLPSSSAGRNRVAWRDVT